MTLRPPAARRRGSGRAAVDPRHRPRRRGDARQPRRRTPHPASRAPGEAGCVVGGGITAIELAEGLAAQRVETHYLMRGDRYWASVLEPARVGARRGAPRRGRHPHPPRHGAGPRDRAQGPGGGGRDPDGGRAAVRPPRGGDRHAAADRAGPSRRASRPAAASGPTTTFQTSDPDIFAAGDAAEVLDPATGKRGLDSLWSVAIEQGRAAGDNLSGVVRHYRRPRHST